MRSGCRGAVIALMALLAVGCEPRYNGAVVADVSPVGWEAGQSVELRYESIDTLTARNVWVVARVEADHNRPPVELTIECVAPDSARLQGSVVLRPQAHKGGSFVELRGLWVEDAVMQRKGDYLFRLSHQTAEPLTDIWSVGIEIE